MNWLDIGLLMVLGYSAFDGLLRGLIKEIFSLAGFMLGIFLAGRYHSLLAVNILQQNSNPGKILAFVIIIGITVAVAFIAASILQKSISTVGLGWLNRLGGVLFGLVAGAAGCSALLALLIKFPLFSFDKVINQSALAAFLLNRFPLILSLLPREFDSIRSFFS